MKDEYISAGIVIDIEGKPPHCQPYCRRILPGFRNDGRFIPDSQRDDLLDLRKSRGIRKLV